MEKLLESIPFAKVCVFCKFSNWVFYTWMWSTRKIDKTRPLNFEDSRIYTKKAFKMLNSKLEEKYFYLNGCQAEECNPNVTMIRILISHWFTAKFESSSPASNPNYISRKLEENMQVEPCWFPKFKFSQKPCCNCPNWKQYSPTHHIQYSMDLHQNLSNF